MPNTFRHVPTIGLLLTVAGAVAAPAAAQSGPWRPEPTLGIAVGVSDDGNWSGRAPTTGWRRGGYLRGGIEVQVTDALAVDGEGGLHVVPQSLYPGAELRGELVLRVKFGL